MTVTHNLGFPRIGARRELKFALEEYWSGQRSVADLQQLAQSLRYQNWQHQHDAGLDFVSDCGLKTRRWEEVQPALAAMVSAAKVMRNA